MKKSGKKASFILPVAIVIMVTIFGAIMLLIKDNNQEQSKTEDMNKNETKVEMSEVNPSRGEFTQIESDGTVVNISEKLKRTKIELGFELSNINYSEKDGNTTLEADVTNLTGSNQENFMAEIVLLDKDGKEQARIPVAIPEMQISETVRIQAEINESYANAYNFRLDRK